MCVSVLKMYVYVWVCNCVCLCVCLNCRTYFIWRQFEIGNACIIFCRTAPSKFMCDYVCLPPAFPLTLHPQAILGIPISTPTFSLRPYLFQFLSLCLSSADVATRQKKEEEQKEENLSREDFSNVIWIFRAWL